MATEPLSKVKQALYLKAVPAQSGGVPFLVINFRKPYQEVLTEGAESQRRRDDSAAVRPLLGRSFNPIHTASEPLEGCTMRTLHVVGLLVGLTYRGRDDKGEPIGDTTRPQVYACTIS